MTTIMALFSILSVKHVPEMKKYSTSKGRREDVQRMEKAIGIGGKILTLLRNHMRFDWTL